jgi:hypothetical protein
MVTEVKSAPEFYDAASRGIEANMGVWGNVCQ